MVPAGRVAVTVAGGSDDGHCNNTGRDQKAGGRKLGNYGRNALDNRCRIKHFFVPPIIYIVAGSACGNGQDSQDVQRISAPNVIRGQGNPFQHPLVLRIEQDGGKVPAVGRTVRVGGERFENFSACNDNHDLPGGISVRDSGFPDELAGLDFRRM